MISTFRHSSLSASDLWPNVLAAKNAQIAINANQHGVNVFRFISIRIGVWRSDKQFAVYGQQL